MEIYLEIEYSLTDDCTVKSSFQIEEVAILKKLPRKVSKFMFDMYKVLTISKEI